LYSAFCQLSPAQSKSIRSGWRKPLPVLVRINAKPAAPWRINMMPAGALHVLSGNKGRFMGRAWNE
jgi:hypothetical protein